MEENARGIHLRQSARPLVSWNQDGSGFESGPGASHYESTRKRIGIHLFMNAFWIINNFCIHQMLMRDPMHQIDQGVFIQVMKGSLRKFKEEIETVLGSPFAAVHKLTSRLKLLFDKHEGQDKQM